MGEMIINYSKLNGLSNTAKKAADRYNKRINQLEGFRKKLDELDTLNTGNLNQANLQIKNRINECINKKEKMTIFKQKIDELENEVLNTDRKVAKRIKQDSKYFKVKNNIKTGIGTHIRRATSVRHPAIRSRTLPYKNPWHLFPKGRNGFLFD